MKKVFVSSISALLLSTVLLTDVSHAEKKDLEIKTNLIEASSNSYIDEEITVSNWARNIGVKGLFAALDRASQHLFNRSPSNSYGGTRDTSSSGTIHFNQGSQKVASVRKDVQVVKRGHEVEMWANNHNLLSPTAKIVVLLTTPGGSDVINRSVGHNQYSWYKATSTGQHRARYITSNAHSWTLWQAYYHWGDLASVCTGCTQSIGDENNSASFTKANNENGDTVTFENVDGRKHVVSESNQNAKAKNNINSTNNSLTLGELYLDFYDEDLEVLTDTPKSFTENDIVVVSDTIADIQFIEETNETEFLFTTPYSNQTVNFSGDLTHNYKVGQEISFKFEFVKIYPDKEYLTLDYRKQVEDNDNIAPSIKDYLAK
ncbi:hypothetical protein [Sutcliffiella rhizosphaerae]|uniref:Uncharacterized protein n=1 Tax=Sutcliffiella rhizosphaerae TaxID=2880967 RepID=A0ABM8YLP7_9BACI|nr:hypothetical protein [Sutcliffiella rhizosphaerae]CAG9620910.1 hypothetical protein BACCIP111883_01682 [Sutcliffiella rhizosphaerae]